MAFTDVWNPAFNAIPLGGAQISGGDDAIRQTRLAVYERLAAILNDINIDPPTIKLAVLGTIGAQVDRPMLFGPHIFSSRNDEDDTNHNDSNYQHNDTGLTSVGSLYLPHGITIKKLEAIMDRSLGADVSLELYKINLATGAKTVLDTAVRAVAGIGVASGAIANPPGIGEVVDVTAFHYACRFFAAGFVLNQPKIYGVRLLVDVPGVQAAV